MNDINSTTPTSAPTPLFDDPVRAALFMGLMNALIHEVDVLIAVDCNLTLVLPDLVTGSAAHQRVFAAHEAARRARQILEAYLGRYKTITGMATPLKVEQIAPPVGDDAPAQRELDAAVICDLARTAAAASVEAAATTATVTVGPNREAQRVNGLLALVNHMVERHHVAEKLLKAYIVKETVAASNVPHDSLTGVLYERKLESLDEILKAVDKIDDRDMPALWAQVDALNAERTTEGPTLPAEVETAIAKGLGVTKEDMALGGSAAMGLRALDAEQARHHADFAEACQRIHNAVPGEVLPAEHVTKIRDVQPPGSPDNLVEPNAGDVVRP